MLMPLGGRGLLGALGMGKGAGGVTLPYTLDPSTDSKPSWLGDTLEISGGVLINTPTLGANLITGDMDGPYSGGLDANLTKAGSPTVSEDTSTPHGGTSAQVFAATAQYDAIRFPDVAPTAGQWHEFGGYAKRASGTGAVAGISVTQTSGGPQAQSTGAPYTDAAYTLKRLVKYARNSNNLRPWAVYELGSSNFATVHLDDFYLKQITKTDLFQIYDWGAADVIVKIKLNWAKGTMGGVVARATADLSSYLSVYYWASGFAYSMVVLEQNLNGTITYPIIAFSNHGGTGAGGTPDNTEWLELRLSGTTAKVYHNDVQVSTDKTVDASLSSNTRHGLILSEGVSSNLFFVGAN